MIKLADYRQDEGLRIRHDLIAPTLTAHSGGGLGHFKYLIEVTDNESIQMCEGGAVNIAYPTSKERRGRIQDNGHTVPTLMSGSSEIGTTETDKNNSRNVRIRKLTPKECFRLQGFPDEYYERAAQVNSDSQLYKQAGNSVTVNVIYEIAKRL